MNDQSDSTLPAQGILCEHCGKPVFGPPHVERNPRNEIFFMGHAGCSAPARRLLRALALSHAPSFRSMRGARACLKHMGVKLNKLASCRGSGFPATTATAPEVNAIRETGAGGARRHVPVPEGREPASCRGSGLLAAEGLS